MSGSHRTIVAIGAIVLGMCPRQAVSAQEPSLKTVLDRASTYAAEFKRQLSGIVAEEDYVQDLEIRGFVRIRPDIMHRDLKSDLLLVRPSEAERYVEFRDVYEVDGRPVRDRQQRLTSLFLNGAGSKDQLERIIFESARYNIGNIRRTINTPTLALMFLDPAYLSRFTFTRASDRLPTLVRDLNPGQPAASHFSVGTDAWVVEYREGSEGTIIRSPEGHAVPAHGRFWIDPATGRLLMTELIAEDAEIGALIDVSYQSAPLVGFFVPIEMRERYDSAGLIVTGKATYRNFRRFEVTVNESVGAAKPPSGALK